MRTVLLLVPTLFCGGVGGWLIGRGDSQIAAAAPADTPASLASGPVPLAPGAEWIDDRTIRGDRHYYRDYPARDADGRFNAIVEIPAGTNAKWEVVPEGTMTLELRDGRPRVVKFLPYPGNYGMIPGTKSPKELGGDGDALDVLILGPTLPRGTIAKVRPIGLMKFLDGGEQDDKLLAVMDDTPLGGVRSLKELDERFPEASAIVLKWFQSYKGSGKMEFKGWCDVDEAMKILEIGIAAAR